MNNNNVSGNLTKDAEVKTFKNGGKVVNFTMAVNKIWADKETGEKKKKVSYIHVSAWGFAAKIAEKFVKGQYVVVAGEIAQDRWEKDGRQYDKTYIEAQYVYAIKSEPKENGAAEDKKSMASGADEVPF